MTTPDNYDLAELNEIVLPTLKEYALCPVHKCWHDAQKQCVSCQSARFAKRRRLMARQAWRRKCAVASLLLLASSACVYYFSVLISLR